MPLPGDILTSGRTLLHTRYNLYKIKCWRNRLTVIVDKSEYITYNESKPYECEKCGWRQLRGAYHHTTFGTIQYENVVMDSISIDRSICRVLVRRCSRCGAPYVGGHITYDVGLIDLGKVKYMSNVFVGSKDITYEDDSDSI